METMIERQQFSQREAIAFPLRFSTPSYDKAFLQALKNLHGTRLRAGWCPLAYALQYAMPDLTTNADPVQGGIARFMCTFPAGRTFLGESERLLVNVRKEV